MSGIKGLRVAVVGATGVVGREMIAVLASRRFPVADLLPLASERSAGEHVEWGGADVLVEALDDDAFEGIDLALFSAGASVSERYAPLAVKAGAVVVDNTSAFRMLPEVPLVVPEINAHALVGHRGIIANPNCSTIQMVLALAPLEAAAGVERVVVSTYQAASGAGRDAMDELRDQTIDLLNFREAKVKHFARRLAFDVIPQIDTFQPDGRTREERKMIDEPRKIMERPDLRVAVTCVRVPVFVGHCVSLNVELRGPLPLARALEVLRAAPGLVVADRPEDFPTAADAAGQDEVFIGRVRIDDSVPHGLDLWVVADNLRKGAATNAVQICEALLARDLLRVP